MGRAIGGRADSEPRQIGVRLGQTLIAVRSLFSFCEQVPLHCDSERSAEVTAVVLGRAPHDRAPSISAWLGCQFSNRGECPGAAGTDLTARYWPTRARGVTTLSSAIAAPRGPPCWLLAAGLAQCRTKPDWVEQTVCARSGAGSPTEPPKVTEPPDLDPLRALVERSELANAPVHAGMATEGHR